METTFDLRGTWQADRLGMFTSSEIHRLFSDPKTKADKEAGKLSEKAMTYVLEKAAEILTGHVKEIGGLAIEWGIENESPAAAHYERITGRNIDYHGGEDPKFHSIPAFEGIAGGSPDFFDGEMVGEIKCPFNSGNHLVHLGLVNDIDLKDKCFEYWSQIQANMLFTGRTAAVFVSFDPRMIDERLKMKIIEVGPDYEFQKEIVERLQNADRVLRETLNQITR